MNSKTAIEEFRRMIRGIRELSSVTHKSAILRLELDEQQKQAKMGEPCPPVYHNMTTPLQDMQEHIEGIFAKQIGRLIVKEQASDVWDELNKRRKRGQQRKPLRRGSRKANKAK